MDIKLNLAENCGHNDDFSYFNSGHKIEFGRKIVDTIEFGGKLVSIELISPIEFGRKLVSIELNLFM